MRAVRDFDRSYDFGFHSRSFFFHAGEVGLRMKKPVLPYVLKDSKYCGERPNCKASMEQATPPRRAKKRGSRRLSGR